MGRTNAEVYVGICPNDLQRPRGKSLTVSCIGTEPFIDDDYFDGDEDSFVGSEMLVTQIFAEKFNFLPNFVPETESFDGMVHGVKYHFTLHVRV